MKIKVLPLDERPCNIRFAEKICSYNKKVSLLTPSIDILGKKKQPGNEKAIKEFIFNDHAERLVISLDTYLYGGLLASRLHQMSFDQINQRLQSLRQLKKENKMIKIYAFSTIMRTPRYNSSDEEPDYYQEYGEAIFTKKFLEDKSKIASLTIEERQKLESIIIPRDYEMDYQNRRDINLLVNLEIVKLLEDDVFEYLIFPQDDSAEYGYTRIDQSEVYQALAKLNPKSYSVHPGADEVLMTMIARIYNQAKITTPKLYIKFENDDYKNQIPLYEDRAISKTLNLHLEAAGFNLVEDEAIADDYLYYNVPQCTKMIESFDQDLDIKKQFDLSIFKQDKVYILDNCYSNGGDIALLKTLKEQNLLNQVVGYSGWNTNANSLGTILCMIALGDDVDKVKLQNFIFERYIEDGLYQAIVRMQISLKYLEKMQLTYFDLKTKQDEIVTKEITALKEYSQSILGIENFKINISHPWNRMFEIDIDVELQ